MLQGAKSPSRYSLLENAINSKYQGFSVEFSLIDDNTKVIEVKPKLTQPKPQMNIPQPTQNPIKQEELKEQTQDEEKEQTSPSEKRHFSPQVQDMIEQFNGRIID